jgi:hypothetical protein
MPITKKQRSPGFEVDGRVSIALDALDDAQKQALGGVLSDRDHFIASTASGRNVTTISKNNQFYALRAPGGLRIIYSKVGDDIVVMDVMRQATLDRYGSRKTAKAKVNGAKKVRSSSHVKKAK